MKLKMKIAHVTSITIVLTFLISAAKGNACGGVITSDGGKFVFTKRNVNEDLQCVWILQLLSRQTTSFTLNRLEDFSATLTLYPDHDASEGVLNPIRLTKSEVGQTLEFAGKAVVIILNRSDYQSEFEFTWDSISSSNPEVHRAANYVDNEKGELLWNRFSNQQYLITWVLNLESSLSLDLKAEAHFSTCELLRPCDCSYFGLYEITSQGYLREVTRMCGRSLSFETSQLYPKLVAFVYTNSTSSNTEHVQLSWFAESVTTEEPETTEAIVSTTTEVVTESTTEAGPEVISLGCGGLINLPPQGGSILVEYKSSQEYDNYERCLWSLNDNQFDGIQRKLRVNVTLLSHGFEYKRDGLAFLWWDNDGLGSRLLELEKPHIPFEHYLRLYLSFTSDSSVVGTGFLLSISSVQYYSSNSTGETLSFSNSESGAYSYKYGPPRNVDRVSIAVNPPEDKSSFVFGVDYIKMWDSPACNVDNIKIFEIFELDQFKERDKLCGTSESPLEFPLKFSVLVHFTAYGSYEADFGISWNATKNSDFILT